MPGLVAPMSALEVAAVGPHVVLAFTGPGDDRTM